ncbi:MAG: imidazole glycerol phosphate synthase subunit HisH [Anaerovibrio sp.]|uniref:imidazole glycerol phosphate synthase subunit HisH n=1 Tax=Anaerovibrio sp. TaxID=1872532 RepID=UPI0025F929FA|nr:imidazole glycerol phosphate synthase subunit HisH [Anaerovibrio sp.]MCR5175751.1 imidazole glycerol phosphate synthase subunit HisH [Anaerovibrio sp.]
MIAIIDYGVGNLFSVEKAFSQYTDDVMVTDDRSLIEKADKLVLPGVGDFGACMDNFQASGLCPAVMDRIAAGTPLFGICVGLQILFEGSEESPDAKGLGVFKGKVRKIHAPGLKVPHMGWNSVEFAQDGLPFFEGLPANPFFYFVHSYHAVPDDESIIAATVEYGEQLTAAVYKDNVMATQFHPEKSGDVGLMVIKNFIDWKCD